MLTEDERVNRTLVNLRLLIRRAITLEGPQADGSAELWQGFEALIDEFATIEDLLIPMERDSKRRRFLRGIFALGCAYTHEFGCPKEILRVGNLRR